jgi:predicted AAA+ superfamily ATPase
VRKIEPWYKNTKKRLVKSPRIYLRDSGILHRLLNITNYDGLLSYPLVGQSWEGFIIENLLSVVPATAQYNFYRTSGGAEIDLILEFPNQKIWAIEIKRSSSPKVTKGFYQACEDIQPNETFVVYNGEETFPLPNGVVAIGLPFLMEKIIKEIN